MGTGILRYADRLPTTQARVTLGEGDTPLIPLPTLSRRYGLDLWAKMESHNPTGSYKDRAGAMSISLALDRQCRGWIATSSGNAGAAMAAYGARAGMRGLLCVVSTIPKEKLAPLLALGAHVVKVKGLGDHANPEDESALFREVRRLAAKENLFLGITANSYNPDGMRGVDTIGYELADAGVGGPVYVPTGGGGLATCIARGLAACDVASPLVVAQPTGCAPIVRFLNGELARPLETGATTRISGLQLPAPPDGQAAADAVKRSAGWGTAVDDQAILRARDELATTEGVFVEPASATALAAVISDRDSGRLDARQPVVCVLTGHGLKNMNGLTTDAGAPVAVSGIEREVAHWLGKVRDG